MANPYPAGTSAFDEYIQWERGVSAGGVERDFLRAFHSQAAVTALRDKLASSCGLTAKVRVSSIWIDKYPLAFPQPPHATTYGSREIADLAVIVRRTSRGRLDQRMWIVQGKVESRGWQNKDSSPKEIDLLENCPAFDLYTSSAAGAKRLGTFDLRQDFGPPPYRGQPFWSYLLFADRSHQSSFLTPSHASAIWPNTMGYSSGMGFYQCVERQFAATRSPLLNAFGARVDRWTPYPVWRRLYVTLLAHVRSKLPARLSGGPWHTSAWTRFLENPSNFEDPFATSPPGDGGMLASTGFGELDRTFTPAFSALLREDFHIGRLAISMRFPLVSGSRLDAGGPDEPFRAI